MTPSTSDALAINVLDPHMYVDPWEAYRWLRDEAPVYWDPRQQLWAIARYDDVLAVEKNTERYTSFDGSRPHLDERHDHSMINLDDPVHQEQRNVVARRFSPRAVRSHEDHVRAIVTEVLDDVAPRGECEAIDAIASRVPSMMITELLGYPPEWWEHVRHWSEQIMLLAGQTSAAGPPHVQHPGIVPIATEYFTMTMQVIEARRREPTDDLISVWVKEGWDDKHVLEETILVLAGGAETTRTVIGSMMRELALQPDQRDVLQRRPKLLGTTATEEFIRWVSPVLNMRRTAAVDHELHDQTIRAGDQLLLMYASANRDPRAFDDPDRLDVTRPNNRHVSFGFGSHFCLGASLARLEIRVMFEELLRRIPDWELIDPDEPKIIPASFARAYDRIRIAFTPS